MRLPSGFKQGFGPGLLWAAAAIGVSHLVQSTRAGALAGFGLSGVILLRSCSNTRSSSLAHAMQPRRDPASLRRTTESVVGRCGCSSFSRSFRWSLLQAAVVLFTAFLLQQIVGGALPLVLCAAAVMAVSGLMLVYGQYR